MLASEIKNGEIYWTIRESDETTSYDLDPEPRKPYRVKAKWTVRFGSPMLQLHCFNRESGELDYDSNATITPCIPVTTTDVYGVYGNFQDAKTAYCFATRTYANLLRNQADKLDIAANEYESAVQPSQD